MLINASFNHENSTNASHNHKCEESVIKHFAATSCKQSLKARNQLISAAVRILFVKIKIDMKIFLKFSLN